MKRVEVDSELLECKAHNHAWEPCAPVLHHKGLGARTLFLVCVRCGSEKYQDLGPQGELWSTKITPSFKYKDFLVAHPRMSRANARAELHKWYKKNFVKS